MVTARKGVVLRNQSQQGSYMILTRIAGRQYIVVIAGEIGFGVWLVLLNRSLKKMV